MPYFDGAAGRIYYRHWRGEEPGRVALVFLPGFGDHSGLYHRFGAELGHRGVELWALDQQGHGLSDGARGDFGSFETMVGNASMLTDLVIETSPERVVVAGHSLGAVGALFTALQTPSRFDGVAVTGAPLSPLAWFADVVDAGGETFALDLDALSADPFYRDELENDPLAFLQADVLPMFARLVPPAWRRLDAELPTLTLPVLALHGAADPIVPVDSIRGWRGRLPNLQLLVFDDAAHDLINEVAHTAVADRIARFVVGTGR